MKTYLRIYCNQKQNNWVTLLPMAQLAYNNKTSESTGQTPFYANHGKHPNLFTRTIPCIKAEAAMKTVEELQEIHEKLRDNLEIAQRNSISYVNRKRKMAPQLKKGDKVYLLTKNLRTKRPSKGLDHVKVGPFLISKQISPVNYQLELPRDAKVHPVFHVSMLEPADPATPIQMQFRYQEEEPNEFEVEKILRKRGRGGYQEPYEYLVKWKGYPHTENTWEPETNLMNCQQRLREFRQEHPRNQ
jgi:hypothetical protein